MNQKFYEFRQNNSGGKFVTDDKLCKWLFIEADDEKEANDKAKEMGVYFNGCEDGKDCSCCGDRWSSPDEIKLPYRYGELSLKDAKKSGQKYEKTTWRFMGTHDPNPNRYDLIFDNIEEYAKYVVGRYNLIGTNPAARVFYNHGQVVEIEGK